MRTNPVRRSLANLPDGLKKEIRNVMHVKHTPGVLKEFMLESVATPYGAKANCYAHFLVSQQATKSNQIIA